MIRLEVDTSFKDEYFLLFGHIWPWLEDDRVHAWSLIDLTSLYQAIDIDSLVCLAD